MTGSTYPVPPIKELMVQLQTFTAKKNKENNCFDKISYKIDRKMVKLFNSFEISKNIILKFSGLHLIGQNDSLDALLIN